MRPRLSRTDCALVIVAVALVVVWFTLPQAGPSDQFALADWTDLSEHAPERISLRRGTEELVLEHDSTQALERRYSVKGHPEQRTDPAAVDRFLRALGNLEPLRVTGPETAHIGLSEPASLIRIETRGETRSLELGAKAPGRHDGRYAAVTRHGRREAYVLSVASTEALEVSPQQLLDHRVLPWLPSELQQIELDSPKGPITLERHDNGKWQNASPARGRVPRPSMDRLLLALTDLRLTKFLDPKQARKPDAPVRLRVSARARAEGLQHTATFEFVGSCPGPQQELTLAKVDDRELAGCVGTDALGPLLDPGVLVDDALFSFHTDEIERLEVSTPAAHWALRRSGSEFRLKTDREQTISLESGNGLLDSLVATHGRVVGTCSSGAKRESGTITLTSYVVGAGEPVIERLDVGSDAGDGSRAVCREDGLELLLDPSTALRIDLDPGLLRDPVLTDVEPTAVTEVRIKAGNLRYLLRADEGGRLLIRESKGASLDAGTIETLREQLARLHARRWLPSSFYRLRETRSTLSIEFVISAVESAETDSSASSSGEPKGRRPEEAGKHELQLYLSVSDELYASFDDQPNPFEADPAWSDLVKALRLAPASRGTRTMPL